MRVSKGWVSSRIIVKIEETTSMTFFSTIPDYVYSISNLIISNIYCVSLMKLSKEYIILLLIIVVSSLDMQPLSTYTKKMLADTTSRVTSTPKSE